MNTKLNSVIAAGVDSPSSLGADPSTGDSPSTHDLMHMERLHGTPSHPAIEATTTTTTTMTTNSDADATSATRFASDFDPVVGGTVGSADGSDLDGIGLGINLASSLRQRTGDIYDYPSSCQNMTTGLSNTIAANSSADPFLSSPMIARSRTATRGADVVSEGSSQRSPDVMGLLPSIVRPSQMQRNSRFNACSLGSSHEASLDNIIPRTDNLSLGPSRHEEVNRLPSSFETKLGLSTTEDTLSSSNFLLDQKRPPPLSMRTDNSLNEYVSPLTSKTGLVSRLPPESFTSYGSFDRDNRSRCFALEAVPRNLSCLTLAALFDRQEFQSLSSQSPACMDLVSLGIVYVSFGDSRDAFAAAQKIQRMHPRWHVRQMTAREYVLATQYQERNAGFSVSDFQGWVVVRVSRMANSQTTRGDDLRGLFQSIKCFLEKFGDIKGLHTFYPPSAGSSPFPNTAIGSLPSPKSPALPMSGSNGVSRNASGCGIWGPPKGAVNGQDEQNYIFEIIAEFFDTLSAENAVTSLNGNAIDNYYLAIRHYTPDLDGADVLHSTPVRSPYAPISPFHEETAVRGSGYPQGVTGHNHVPLSPHSQSFAQSPPPFSPVSNFRETASAPRSSILQAHRSQASPPSLMTANLPPPPTPLSPYTDSSHHLSDQVQLSPTGRSIIPAGDDAVRWGPTRPSTSAPPQSLASNSGFRERDGETCRDGSGQRVRGQNGQNYVDLDKIRRGLDVRTTIMLRNIPNKIDQTMLKDIVDETSFGKYDFMYLRIDFANNCNVGYAFINFEDPIDIIAFAKARAGRSWNCFNSDKVAEISYATIQGKDCLVQKFRNSSVMLEHPSFRPKIFHTGTSPLASTEAPFPPPDNPSKMRRSLENAECIGLFPPRVGAQYRDEMRRRRGIWDRGITVTDRDLERERAMCFQGRAELSELPPDGSGFSANTAIEMGISDEPQKLHHQAAYASPRLSPANVYGAPLRSIEGVNSAAGLWH